jgi:NAD(P)-dependent dehydrogenase (short-subunit alcohol dehydrogenase family)
MTKHALEAMGQALRIELAPLGIHVTLVNPGPYLTGLNDRRADSRWEWIGDGEQLRARGHPRPARAQLAASDSQSGAASTSLSSMRSPSPRA